MSTTDTNDVAVAAAAVPAIPTPQQAIEMLAARRDDTWAKWQKDDESVQSPCISICRMTADRSHCQGCFRTIPEIKAWSQASPDARWAIWLQVLGRAGLEAPSTIAP